MTVRIALFASLLSIAWGCGGGSDPDETMDAGPEDAASGDADVGDGAVDSGNDAAPADAAMDAPMGRDGGPAVCGDEVVERDEVCDDGNTEDGDGCSADCMSDERCGNSIVDEAAGEVCDDGNTVNGDGCNADCSSDESCGNGTVDIGVGEECDDGNTDDDDGCSSSCENEAVCGDGVVHPPEVCDDGNTANGDGCSADCSSDESCGNGIVDTGEECDDGNTTAGDGCSPTCVAEACGNGVVDPGEDCDDGNTTEGDGCDTDCTFSCTGDADCDDGELCTGDETCDTSSHTCQSGTPPADGTDCGGGLVCRSGMCRSPVCGNGILEGTEECDDGNSTSGDGCDADCTYSCTGDADCDDGEVCTGTETCDTSTHTCQTGTPLSDGDACGTGLVCRGGACRTVVCGDGLTEGTEACDDGNAVDGDGCDTDCTFSCTTNAECDDGEVCTGDETCDTSTHTCQAGSPLSDGSSCGSGLVCRSGSCRTVVCGDGLTEGTEACDDGNDVNGDGCDTDCTFSCTSNAECDDGLLCNGSETCDTSTHTCQAGTPESDGTPCGTDMVCRSGTCSSTDCGDGLTEGSEECDDGNTTDGDGCDNDCTFSCTADSDCTDGRVCNGTETCELSSHTCQTGSPPGDGTLCDRDGASGTRDICLSDTCVASVCGDGYVDSGAGEDCEDGNSVDGDGCDNDCTFSCAADADCSDGRVCNGAETCDTSSHTCQAGSPPGDGTLCDRDGDSGTRDICLAESCVASTCGDGYLDPGAGEDCEDGNTVNGDGCDNDCTFSCAADADCSDGLVCNGAEICNTSTHVCEAGAAPGDGTLCDRDGDSGTRDICLSESCVASTCGDGFTDGGGGEDCDDGNSTNGDGCDNDCTYSCAGDVDCDDGDLCNGAETCDTSTHTCQAGTPEPDGTLCDVDGDPATRDLCLSAMCRPSACGDGYVDSGNSEYCDDGNAVNGDGCETSCLTTGSRAFRIDTMRLRDPHIYADVPIWGCRDITDAIPLSSQSVNNSLQDSLDSYTLNYINLFRPLNIAAATTPLDIIDGECNAASPRPECRLSTDGAVYVSTANNMGIGSTCYEADPTTLNSLYVPPNTVSGPCYVTDPQDIEVDMGGTVLPLQDARFAASYSGGPPPTNLITGVISGFLSETDAMSVIIPESVSLIGGDTLYEHLAAGGAPGSSCTSRDDRDTYMGVTGFWFYIDFTAVWADWDPAP